MSPARLKDLLHRYGSPLYVYDASVIEARCKELLKAFPYATLYYACKANENPAIVKLIAKHDFGIETVSLGEVAVARKVGVSPSRITFTCGSISEKELVTVAKEKVRVHLDSLSQVEWFAKHKLGKDISVRLNLGVGAGHHSHVITGGPDSKFGIDESEIVALERLVKNRGVRITGLHQHIGSNVLEPRLFLKGVDVLLRVASRFPHLTHLDFGGGFGVPYMSDHTRLDLDALSRGVRTRLETFSQRYGRRVEISFEPGRYLVAEAGSLFVTVTDIKKNPKHTFVGVDSGMNHLLRPALYGSYHELRNLSRPRASKKHVSIAGNICESGDVFAKGRLLPMPRIGDIFEIRNAGAYGYAMSSDYNLRPRPLEILITRRGFRAV